MNKELSEYLLPRDNNPSNYKVFEYLPKKIFQTFESHEVSEKMYCAVQTWIDKNPDWEYYFFDNQARHDFIEEHFPTAVLEAYETLLPGAYKADLWRYCVLYIHGGIYCDIKQELKISLNDVIPSDVEFLSIKDSDKNREFSSSIYQAFICAKPRHPFLQKVIEVVVDHVQTGYYGYDSVSPTGPAALGKAINLILNKPENHSLMSGLHTTSGYRYVLWSEDFSNKRCLTDKGEHFINTVYKGYGKERKEKSIKSAVFSYARAWYFNNIYTHGKVYRPNDARYQQKIKSQRAMWVKDLYHYGNKAKARSVIYDYFCKRQFSLHLLPALFYYEFIYPLVSVFRPKK